MNTAFETLDDPRALGQALAEIGALSALLEKERRAVAVLDPRELREIGEQKAPLVERLQALTRAAAQPDLRVAAAGDVRSPLRAQVRDAAGRLLAQAEANAALLNDAIHALSAALGIEQEMGTYDARARVQRRVRAFARKRA